MTAKLRQLHVTQKKKSMDKQRQKLKLLVICVREVKLVLFINV